MAIIVSLFIVKMPKRRRSNEIPCDGQCGKKCTRSLEREADLTTHLDTTRYNCEHCKKHFSRKGSLQKHVQKEHPAKAPEGRKNLKNPSTLTNPEWFFLKKCVRNSIQHDLHSKVSEADRLKLENMNNNQTIQDLTVQLAQRLETNRLDDFGGNVPLQLRPHGGLFQLSLDRMVNNDNGYCLHFPDIQNAFANIRIVPLCLNVQTFPITFKDVQDRVRNKVNLSYLLEYERLSYRKISGRRKNTILYSCVSHIFQRDPLAQKKFKTCNNMWK